MGYSIVRLIALDWDATVAALRSAGDSFYWHARDSVLVDIDLTRIPFVAEFDGSLDRGPGWRDHDAGEIYDGLRAHLDDETRTICDACFSRLFWNDDVRSATIDLEPWPDDGPEAAVQNALRPSTVCEVLALLRRVSWPALHAAAEHAEPWQSKYLPQIEDFKGHVEDHSAFLGEAMRRNAGVLALISA